MHIFKLIVTPEIITLLPQLGLGHNPYSILKSLQTCWEKISIPHELRIVDAETKKWSEFSNNPTQLDKI